jgi:hypothetical protein
VSFVRKTSELFFFFFFFDFVSMFMRFLSIQLEFSSCQQSGAFSSTCSP